MRERMQPYLILKVAKVKQRQNSLYKERFLIKVDSLGEEMVPEKEIGPSDVLFGEKGFAQKRTHFFAVLKSGEEIFSVL